MFEARDHVHVQLRHEVAERGDVELVRLEGIAQRARGAVDLVGQQVALRLVEIDQFARLGQARHQHQPWVVGVVHQPQFAQRERRDRMGVGGQLRMQFVADAALRWLMALSRLPCSQANAASNKASVRDARCRALAASKTFGSTSRLKACPAG